MVPGHPEHGPFFLAKGLLNVMREHAWGQPTSQVLAYGYMISLFCAMAQKKTIYSAPGVEGNDVLFARDEGYMEELQGVIDKLVEECIKPMPQFKLASVPLELLNRLLSSSKMSPKCAVLAWEVFGHAKRCCASQADRAWLRNTAQYTSTRAGGVYAELGKRMLDACR